MKKTLISACFLAMHTLTIPSYSGEARATPQEALLLRRIGEYWKEGSYATAKEQILDFLSKYQDSPMRDNLHAMLGDLYFQENNFEHANRAYDAIQGEKFQRKTRLSHLKALYRLEKYAAVADKIDVYLNKKERPDAKEEIEMHYLRAESLLHLASKAQDTHLFQEALSHYQKLDQTPYKDVSLLPMAEIHRLLKDYSAAASLYVTLSEKHPERAEDFLFQAAYLQTHESREEAVRTFGQIYQLGGKRATAAAFNQLALLFQMQKHQELIDVKEEALKHIPEEMASQVQFYIGRSYYELGDYQNAIAPLENYLTAAKTEPSELKTTLLSLFNCAHQTNDLALFERALETFRSHFPLDAEGAKAQILHAQLCLKNGDTSKAAADLQGILKDFPDYPEKETLLYDYALVLSKNEQWTESCEAFLSFLKEFPKSESSGAAWRHVLNCSLEELKISSPDVLSTQKEQVAFLLKSLLGKENVFSQEEKLHYELLLGKTFCELKNFAEAISILENHIENHEGHPTLAEAHMLLSSCYQGQKATEGKFIFHAETALFLNPELAEKGTLHLQLFNAHLEKDIDRAADYLFLAFIEEGQPIKRDNHLWLANYYYAKREGRENRQRAILVFEKLFEESAFPITAHTVFLEAESLKYVDLLNEEGQFDKKIALLEKLIEEQKLHPELSWKYQRRALFELAQCYEAVSEKDKALSTYDYLVTSSGRSSSFLSISALLHRTRLQYALLPEEHRQESNPKIAAILDALKDLQIQKKVASEPIHLEAALEYAEIKSALSPADLRNEQELFFLKRLKEDFTASLDIQSQEYNHSKEAFPEKARLVQSYLKFIDVKILQLEAKIENERDQKEKADELLVAAANLLEELNQESESLTPYLLKRVQAISISQN
jgi:tetratricopeptide (TPR) repeat protein